MRHAGLRRTCDLFTAALADPELARVLISKMPAKAAGGPVTAFSRALRVVIIGQMAVGGGAGTARRPHPR